MLGFDELPFVVLRTPNPLVLQQRRWKINIAAEGRRGRKKNRKRRREGRKEGEEQEKKRMKGKRRSHGRE